MTTPLERLAEIRIIPVVVIDDAALAPEVTAALAESGIRCAEITLRTPQGLAALAASAPTPDFVLGAGTVLTVEQVDAAVDAGAQFIVCPGFDDDVVERALSYGVAVLPGIATSTEIQRAFRAGLEVVKFFPADRLGGLATIAALSAPFISMRFVPSGGVSVQNIREYLQHPAIHAVSGSWMVPRHAIAACDFEGIARLSREAATLARS